VIAHHVLRKVAAMSVVQVEAVAMIAPVQLAMFLMVVQ
jgi:hypothetical protein